MAKAKIFEYRRVGVEDSETGLKGYTRQSRKKVSLGLFIFQASLSLYARDRHSFCSVVTQYGNETTYVIGATSQPFAVAN